MVSGTFPGSPKFVSAPTCQGLVFLEEMARQCPVKAVSCPRQGTSGGVCTEAQGNLRPFFLI